MASHRRIRLTPSFQRYSNPSLDGFRVAVAADGAHEMPAEIFAFREVPLQPGAAVRRAAFSHVCSPADLEEFPVGAPLPNASPPWFRLADVDLVFRSRSVAEEAWVDVVAQVTTLVASLDAMDELEALAPIWVGYADGSDGSSLGSLGG